MITAKGRLVGKFILNGNPRDHRSEGGREDMDLSKGAWCSFNPAPLADVSALLGRERCVRGLLPFNRRRSEIRGMPALDVYQVKNALLFCEEKAESPEFTRMLGYG